LVTGRPFYLKQVGKVTYNNNLKRPERTKN
jgi:hypothetical protein